MDVKKRYTEEQIIGFLKEAERGVAVNELCRKHRFSEPGGIPTDSPDTDLT